ncbi:citrate lyase ACP, partial [Shigella flexneri]|nr:citrate lyase ACP [Shigella flexneri]
MQLICRSISCVSSGAMRIITSPLDTQDIDLQINSSVEKQFGDAI